VKRIYLTGRKGAGLYAIVDDSDYDLVAGHSWFWSYYGYAHTTIKTSNGRRPVSMHRFLLGQESPAHFDHINGNKLDNRRCKLRPASRSQNQANGGPQINSPGGIKGLSWYDDRKKWRVRIKSNNVVHYLGYYANKTDAIKAYNAAALKYHGEFARLNPL
jgi:hypothetical protein